MKEFVVLRHVITSGARIVKFDDILIQTKFILKVLDKGNRELNESLINNPGDKEARPVSEVVLLSDCLNEHNPIYVIGTPYDIYKKIYGEF